MVLSDITNEVMSKTKRTDKESRINELVAIVLKNMSIAHDLSGEPLIFDCLKTTHEFSVSENEYYKDLPDDFVFLYARPELRWNTEDGYLLIKKNKNEFEAIFPNLENDTDTARPTLFMLDAEKITFGAKANGTFTIILPYTFRHAEVTSDNDTIYFPEHFRKCIVDGVIAELWDDLDEDEKAEKYKVRHEYALRALSLQDHRNSSSVVIGKVWDL